MKLTEYRCDYYSSDGENVFHALFNTVTPQEACKRCAALALEEQGIELTWLVLHSWEDGEWEYSLNKKGDWNKLGGS